MSSSTRHDSSEVHSAYSNQATNRVFYENLESIFVSHSSKSSSVEAVLRRAWRPEASGSLESHVQQQGSEQSSLPTSANITALSSKEEVERYVSHNEGFIALFIKQRNSFAPLSVSFKLFEAICNEVDISLRFRDFVLHLGDKESEVEIAPPPAWLKPGYVDKKNVPVSLELMCGIRFVELHGREGAPEPSSQWSLRQCAVYCRQDRQKQKTSWMFVSVSIAARQTLLQHWSATGDSAHSSPLEVLRILYGAAICNWRPYLISLTAEVDQNAVNFLGTSLDGDGPVQAIGYKDRQALVVLENKILAARLAARATRDDLAFLQEEFGLLGLALSPSTNVELRECNAAVAYFVRDLSTNLLRLEQLLARLQSMMKLVSSFLDLSNGTALQELSRASRYENETMRRLNERMTELAEKNSEDSATVAVLTTLTLIYLPITVVSNFFSTSFVGTSTSNRIYVTQDWWILFVTAIPLTVLTLYVWRVWSKIKASKIYPSWWPRSHFPDRQGDSSTKSAPSSRPDHVAPMFQTRPSWGQSP